MDAPFSNGTIAALERRVAELEASLAEATEALQHRQRDRHVLLHRLRGPLTVIIGFADTLASRPDAPRERTVERLERISQAARRMNDLLDELAETDSPEPDATKLHTPQADATQEAERSG